MGSNPSKSTHYHGRPLVDPYGRPLGPLGPPNFGPGYAFQNGQFPPGFVPNYGPLPPPQFMLPPQDPPRRRRKSRKTSSRGSRRHSSRGQHMSMPVPNIAAAGPASTSHTSAPVVPMPTPHPAPASATPSPVPQGRSSIRRTQTPFLRPHAVDEEEEEEEEEDEIEDQLNSAPVLPRSSSRGRSPMYAAPESQPVRRTPSRGHPQPVYQHQQAQGAIQALDIVRALEPLEPAHPSAFGPPDKRTLPPLRNPLPPPPRDLYESSPYKSLLTLPQTAALLTANFAPKPKDTKKSRKGLFRAFSSRKHDKEEPKDPQVHFIPIVVNNPPAGVNNMPPMPAIPPLPGDGVPGPSGTDRRSFAHFPNHPEPIRYNEDTDYWAFLNHSSHRIYYNDKYWPTATHLVEARKYLPAHPEIAEEIKLCKDVADVYSISANYQQFQDPAWSKNHLEIMLEVLYLKFSQHADLRSKLWETDNAPLIYNVHNDSFWGVGPNGDGQNMHGKLMEKVRDRLLEGRNPPR